jgi:hypothetical protein
MTTRLEGKLFRQCFFMQPQSVMTSLWKAGATLGYILECIL